VAFATSDESGGKLRYNFPANVAMKASLGSSRLPQIPGSAQSIEQDIRIHGCEMHAGGTLLAPAARNGRKDFGRILHHACLLLRVEQQNAEAFLFEAKGGEDLSANAEIGVPKM
jgi:hypothetical protein